MSVSVANSTSTNCVCVFQRYKAIKQNNPIMLPYMYFNHFNYKLFYLVSLATRIYTFSGITSPKWALNRQFVGPQWGHTWVFGSIILNFTWPRRQLAAGLKLLIKRHVNGTRLHWGLRTPWLNSSNCLQEPVSRSCSVSSRNSDFLSLFSIANASFLIIFQLISNVLKKYEYNLVNFSRVCVHSALKINSTVLKWNDTHWKNEW